MTEYDPEVWHDQAVSLLRLMYKRKWDIFLLQLESCQRTGMLPGEWVLRLQALADKGETAPESPGFYRLYYHAVQMITPSLQVSDMLAELRE